MQLIPDTVFVLGAGFTKSFFPNAPLLRADYGARDLLRKFESFGFARQLLELELAKGAGEDVDLERLMTRLHGLMPYDHERRAVEELQLLLAELKRAFAKALEHAKEGPCHREDLGRIASLCVYSGTSCITFNYDDFLDRALWEVRSLTRASKEIYWHPDGGYGFFCRPSEVLVGEGFGLWMDKTSMSLLKLHGSLNWRVRRGQREPFSVDALAHREDWLPPTEPDSPAAHAIERHLESDPLIVPPMLTKALVHQPVLRLVWSEAYARLHSVHEVVFVGYSLPVTDIAAEFLFREAINSGTTIKVVNYAPDDAAQAEIRRRYRQVFPGLPDSHFRFDGGLSWARELWTANEAIVPKSAT